MCFKDIPADPSAAVLYLGIMLYVVLAVLHEVKPARELLTSTRQQIYPE